MPGLALAVIAIALPDSLNPSLILGAVYLALGPHPVRRSLAFTISAFVVTLAGGLLIAVGVGDLVLALLPTLSKSTKWYCLTALGVALVVGAVVIWYKRRSLAAGEPPSRHERRSAGSPVLMGAGIAGIELLSAFPYFAAIALITGSSESTPVKVALIVLYVFIYVLPLIAIVVVCAVMGASGRRLVAAAGDWVAMRWPVVVAPLAGAAGIALAAYGVGQLA